MENKMQDSGRNRKDFLMDMVKRVYSDDMNLIDLDRELVDKLDDFIASEISKAREEVLLELLEKKTNYKIEKVGHGYKVTQEYVLVSDIEKELSKLSNK